MWVDIQYDDVAVLSDSSFWKNIQVIYLKYLEYVGKRHHVSKNKYHLLLHDNDVT
jgi:hypothetical protein